MRTVRYDDSCHADNSKELPIVFVCFVFSTGV
jgi:hypothetical protein